MTNDEVRERNEEARKDDADLERGARPAGGPVEPVIEVAPGKAAQVVVVRPAEPQRTGGAATWRRRLVLAAGPLALAAAMVVYVGGQSGPDHPDVPAYTVTAVGDRAPGQAYEASTQLRMSKAGGRNARFEVVLRPAKPPQEKVVAYAFTFGASAPEPAPLEAKVEIAPDGTVKLSGASRALEGANELRIVLGTPAAIGKFDDAATRARSAKSDAHVLVLTVPIDRA